MQIKNCMNGHWFDIEKFEVCPECGAPILQEVQTTVKHEGMSNTKSTKSHSKFFNRFGRDKKANHVSTVNASETYNQQTKPEDNKTASIYSEAVSSQQVSDETKRIGHTVSIYDIDKLSPNDMSAKNSAVDEFFNDEANEVTVENPVSQDNRTVRTASNYVENDKEEGDLLNAVKSAKGSSEGKTVGFFAMNNISTDVSKQSSADPVVGWLVALKGVHRGESFQIYSGRNSIGRNSDNKIVLSRDESVSRERHAWIIYEPRKRQFFVQPGESSGLVYVNGDNIMQSECVEAGAKIEIGGSELMLVALCNETFSWEDVSL